MTGVAFVKKHFPHVIAWLALIAYEIVFIRITTGTFSGAFNYIIHYTCNILLFYLHALIVLPYCYPFKGAKRIALVFVLVVGEAIVYIAVKLLLIDLLERSFTLPSSGKPYNAAGLLMTFFRGLYFIGLATGYWLFRQILAQKNAIHIYEQERLKAIIEHQQLEKELLVTQHDFLRSQINPHLVFNSLNFVYNTVSSLNQKAAETIARLTGIMRYALEPLKQKGKVLLQDEIEAVSNYIELYRLKSDREIHVELSLDADPGQASISPVILVTLIENVFKHAILNDPDRKASISITYRKPAFTLHIFNYKNHSKGKPGYGIGVRNIMDRLEKMYHGKHLLQITDDRQTYTLRLSIELE